MAVWRGCQVMVSDSCDEKRLTLRQRRIRPQPVKTDKQRHHREHNQETKNSCSHFAKPGDSVQNRPIGYRKILRSVILGDKDSVY